MEPRAQERKLAAEKASELYARAVDRHRADYKMDMSFIEKAEAAMEAKLAAEKEFNTKITATIDLQELWWFQ
jgi:hypothetical protein